MASLIVTKINMFVINVGVPVQSVSSIKIVAETYS